MRFIHVRTGKRRRAMACALGSVAALLLLLLAGCGGEDESAGAATVDTGGGLQITETMYDFGAVPVGQTVEHKFQLKNTGTGPLQLGQMAVKRLEGC